MLDVIHYLFEEDSTYISPEQLETRDGVREKVYRELYQRGYKYSRRQKSNAGVTDFDIDPEYEDLTPVDPLKPPTKGYTPPTNFNPNRPNPFGEILDAPLG